MSDTFTDLIQSVAPKFSDIADDIEDLRDSHKGKSKKELALIYCNRIRQKYTSIGVASALPSAIPGLGTAAQIAIEGLTISADLLLMLRWMAATCVGVAIIYNKDMKNAFNLEFITILGVWCGVVKITKEATARVATKIAVVQFNKNVSGKMLSKVNQKIGTTILTKYGTKRGGIALGKLIPFGIGSMVAGTFNFVTMTNFRDAAIDYYSNGALEA